jgi:hypothetical protein
MKDHMPELDVAGLSNCRLRHIGKPTFALMLVGLAGISIAAFNCPFGSDGPRRFMMAYLVAFAFVLSISLGSIFFVLIQHLMRAGWSVVVRRLSEFFCMNIVVVGLLFLPIAWTVWTGNGLIYSWSKTEVVDSSNHSHDTELARSVIQPISRVLQEDRPNSAPGLAQSHGAGHEVAVKPYLNRQRFLTTWVVLFAYWIIVSVFYYRNSVAQDTTKDINRTRKMEWWSGVSILLFGFSLTFAAFDLLMMLDATWYSTIFGVYYFAGSAVAAFATLLLCVLLMKRFQLVPDVFSEEVQVDLARLLFAFVFFWAYIAFSQYMLLWYANMPETTGWMVRRGMSTAAGYSNSWSWLVVFLLLSHFLIPFAGIMSRHVKSSPRMMTCWAIWMLVVHYFDLYWIVIPENNAGLTIGLVEIGTGLAVVSVYGIATLWISSRSNLFAVGDPRMNESLTRHAMY